MNVAQGIGLYLSIYREVKGARATVAFPGSEHGYKSTHSDTFQDVLSQMEIYAAINVDKCGDGGVFNVANGDTVSWSQVWPAITKYFGLVGAGPAEGTVPMEDFVKQNRSAWTQLAQKHGLNEKAVDEQNWGHVHFMMVQFDFDRQYDLSRSREVDFTEEIDTPKSYEIVWDRMREAKILPPQQQ
jgi:hypothetical protein